MLCPRSKPNVKVKNTATAHGTPPSGPEVTAPSTATLPAPADPKIDLVFSDILMPGGDRKSTRLNSSHT